MRNALLFLAISLTLVYLFGGSEALVEVLKRVIVLGGVQVITHHLNQTDRRPRELKKTERQRLKR